MATRRMHATRAEVLEDNLPFIRSDHRCCTCLTILLPTRYSDFLPFSDERRNGKERCRDGCERVARGRSADDDEEGRLSLERTDMCYTGQKVAEDVSIAHDNECPW